MSEPAIYKTKSPYPPDDFRITFMEKLKDRPVQEFVPRGLSRRGLRRNIVLNELQEKHLEAIEWLVAGGCLSGRSHLLAYAMVKRAIETESFVQIWDHCSLRGDWMVISPNYHSMSTLIRKICKELGYRPIFNKVNPVFKVEKGKRSIEK